MGTVCLPNKAMCSIIVLFAERERKSPLRHAQECLHPLVEVNSQEKSSSTTNDRLRSALLIQGQHYSKIHIRGDSLSMVEVSRG